MIKNPTKDELLNIKGIIYLIINNITNQKYIGKSINSFIKRYRRDWWKSKQMNRYIKESINKYGHENFSIVLLEVNINNDDILYELEKKYIKQYNSLFPNGYNFSEGGILKGFKGHRNDKKFYIKWIKTEKIVFIDNFKEFCKDNGFTRGTINRMLRGEILYCYNKICLPETTNSDISKYKQEIKKHRTERKQTEESKKKTSQTMLNAKIKKPIEERLKISERMKILGVSKATRDGHKLYMQNIPEKHLRIMKECDKGIRAKKKWKITSPTKEVIISIGLQNFCKDRNLKFRVLYRSYQNNKISPCGWKVELIKD